MIDSMNTYDMNEILEDEPRLREIAISLGKHHHAYAICTGSDFPELVAPEYKDLPVIVIRSDRAGDGWPADVEEQDVVLDALDAGFDSTCYLAWQGTDFSLGIPVSEISELLNGFPRADQFPILWVTNTEFVTDFIDTDERLHDHVDVGMNAWKLSRFVPDGDYIAAKYAAMPPLLSDTEQRIIGGNLQPLYIMRRVDLADLAGN